MQLAVTLIKIIMQIERNEKTRRAREEREVNDSATGFLSLLAEQLDGGGGGGR